MTELPRMEKSAEGILLVWDGEYPQDPPRPATEVERALYGALLDLRRIAEPNKLPPLLKVLVEELKKRGWRIERDEDPDGFVERTLFFSPEHRPYLSLDDVLLCQSMRELAERVIEATEEGS